MSKSSCFEPLNIRHFTGPCVPIAGVPQIPDRVAALLSAGMDELPPDVEAEANAAIGRATTELRKRKDKASGGESHQPVEVQFCDTSAHKARRRREGY